MRAHAQGTAIGHRHLSKRLPSRRDECWPVMPSASIGCMSRRACTREFTGFADTAFLPSRHRHARVAFVRFSQRLPWSISSNSFSRLIAARRSAGLPLLDLTISNPTLALADYPHRSIAQAYGSLANFQYHPDPFGSREARCAVISCYEKRGIQLTPERVALTASTSEAYSILFKLLCDPGGEILVPLPSYPLFDYLARLEGVRVVPYRLLYDGSWFTDFEDLRSGISSSTRAIVVVNPNNPTGSYLKASEARTLSAIAAENELPIISDEVFSDYTLFQSPDRLDTFARFDSVVSFSMNGLSKTAGMPQMKLGWIILNGPARQIEDLRLRLEIILDTYLSVGTPVQNALPALLEIGRGIQTELKSRAIQNWQTVSQLLMNSPAHPLHVEGGWSAILQLPANVSEDDWIARLLEDKGVLVQPGYFFDMQSEAYVVVSLITPPNEFHRGLERLRQLVTFESEHHGPAK